MPIEHTCSCGKKFRLKDECAGKKFRCPACDTVNQIAAPAPANDWFSEELLSQPAPKPSNPVNPAQALSTSPKSATSRRTRKKWAFDFDSKLNLGIGVLLLLAFPIVTFGACNVFRKAKSSANWPSTDGTITHSTIEQKRRKARVYYVPKIEYRYVIDGREYTGSRVSFLVREFDLSESGAKEMANRYPLNSTCKVFYDPADPSGCTLESGTTSTGSLLIALLPIGILAVGVYLVRSSLEAAKR